MKNAPAIGFWRTVRLLLGAARRRSRGRSERQRELLNQRSAGSPSNWGGLASVVAFAVSAFLHGAAAFVLIMAVDAGRTVELQRQGKVVVHDGFLDRVQAAEAGADRSPEAREAFRDSVRREAKDLAERGRGGDEKTIEEQLRAALSAGGSRNLVARSEAEPGLSALGRSGAAGNIAGSLVLLWWLAMLICQGEGLELDLQRRRHPMWEWLLSHPIGAGAVFCAEMLSPLSANPSYWTAPIFVAVLYGASQDLLTGLAAALLVGVPLTVAAACVGKALEIGAVLRLPPRSRGAVIGIMGWFGYASMLALLFGLSVAPRIITAAVHGIGSLETGSWPLVGLFLGLGRDGAFSLPRGLLFCWAASGLMIAAALVFSARSVRHGLAGAFATDTLPARPDRKAGFGREPLFRKEYLWFVRDRSAIVQAILIPVTIAAFQVFNLRLILEQAGHAWNYAVGAAIFFGTYLLWVLGPKSLVSEGSALWIALTWPRGLENVLRVKARLWSLVASALVAPIFIAACWFFPNDAWKVGLAALGWLVFARSMAEKSVTLVTVVSESGEAEKIPSGRRWAAQLGMLTFAIGICSEQWNLAVVGIVYSWITAAAMWENLRARLPYLYDPWSETLPEPPTLMHAMVAISVLVECASVLSALVLALGGTGGLAWARGIGYAICAVGVGIGVSHFLAARGVSQARIWCWREDDPDPDLREPWTRIYLAGDRAGVMWLLIGIGSGLLLGLLGHFYVEGLKLIPSLGDTIRASEAQMRSVPGMTTAYGIMAIGFAPLAEEYLFRGLLFRTLDREWGGWKAMLGAGAFFAIYHPTLSWLPVGLLGVANCALFKRSKRLAPAVLLHMAYNAVIVLWS